MTRTNSKDAKINLNYLKMRVVKSPKTNESFLMRSAYCIGYSAYYVHEVLISIWFKTIAALAAVYGIMRFIGISIEIIRNGDLLLRIR